MSKYKQRFFAKTIPEPNSGCLLWTGCTNEKGYGHVELRGRTQIASRVAYELANGAIPEDMCVLHRCDTPGCVNSDHLFLGTVLDNIQDKVKKGRNKNPNFGQASPQSKLKNKDVFSIRAEYAKGTKARLLANRFNVTTQTIYKIAKGALWAHLLLGSPKPADQGAT